MAPAEERAARLALEKAEERLRIERSDEAAAIVEEVTRGDWAARAQPRLVLRAAHILAETGSLTTARDLAEAQLKGPAPVPELRRLAARMWMRIGANEPGVRPEALRSAETHLTTLLTEVPGDGRSHALLGLVMDRQGRLQEAVESWRCAFVLEPTLDHRVGLAIALSSAGRFREAIPHFRKIATERPRRADAQANLGLALRESGALEEAFEAFRLAAALRPRNPRSHVDLGVTLRRLGRVEEAISAFERAIELDADMPDAHHQLGRTFLQDGRLDDARRVLEEARERSPQDRPIQRSLVELARAAKEEEDTLAVVTPAGPDLSADVSRFPVAEIVEFLAMSRRSGILDVQRDEDESAELELVEGRLLSGRFDPDPPFLEQVAALGVPLPPGLAEVELGEGAAPLFEALLEEGVDREPLAEVGFASAVRTLLGLIDWNEAKAEFRSREPGSRNVERLLEIAVDAQGVLLEAYRRIDEGLGSAGVTPPDFS
ncbi:MAG: tetratricopeptide repeat protein [Myxococcota bacterium]